MAEAMEVLGGIGYCEESELPRLYREMPVNSIWEGSGNIMCLDVLRVLNKQAGVYDLLSEAFVEVKGQDRYFDRAVRRLQQQLRKPAEELGRKISSAIPAGLRCANVEICLSANGAGVVSGDVRCWRRTVVRADPE